MDILSLIHRIIIWEPLVRILIKIHKNPHKKINICWIIKSEKVVPIWKAEFCIVIGSSLSGTKNLKYSKI